MSTSPQVGHACHEQLWMFETKQYYFIVGGDRSCQNFQILILHRKLSKELEISYDNDTIHKSFDDARFRVNELCRRANTSILRSYSFAAILGVLSFPKQYLYIATSARKIADITGRDIFEVESTLLTPIVHPMLEGSSRHNSNDRYRDLIRKFTTAKDLYFSYSYDLTNSVQSHLGQSPAHITGNALSAPNAPAMAHSLIPTSAIVTDLLSSNRVLEESETSPSFESHEQSHFNFNNIDRRNLNPQRKEHDKPYTNETLPISTSGYSSMYTWNDFMMRSFLSVFPTSVSATIVDGAKTEPHQKNNQETSSKRESISQSKSSSKSPSSAESNLTTELSRSGRTSTSVRACPAIPSCETSPNTFSQPPIHRRAQSNITEFTLSQATHADKSDDKDIISYVQESSSASVAVGLLLPSVIQENSISERDTSAQGSSVGNIEDDLPNSGPQDTDENINISLPPISPVSKAYSRNGNGSGYGNSVHVSSSKHTRSVSLASSVSPSHSTQKEAFQSTIANSHDQYVLADADNITEGDNELYKSKPDVFCAPSESYGDEVKISDENVDDYATLDLDAFIEDTAREQKVKDRKAPQSQDCFQGLFDGLVPHLDVNPKLQSLGQDNGATENCVENDMEGEDDREAIEAEERARKYFGPQGLFAGTRWVPAVICGYITQSRFRLDSRDFIYTIITRRSRHHAGTRYLRRGINQEAYVANEVETECILADYTATSFDGVASPLSSNPTVPVKARPVPIPTRSVPSENGAVSNVISPMPSSNTSMNGPNTFATPTIPLRRDKSISMATASEASSNAPPQTPMRPTLGTTPSATTTPMNGPTTTPSQASTFVPAPGVSPLQLQNGSTRVNAISSVVFVRGSIPFFWSQNSSYSMSPNITIHAERDPTFSFTEIHFKRMLTRYGRRVHCVNLIKQREKKPKEMRLGQRFALAVRHVNRCITKDYNKPELSSVGYYSLEQAKIIANSQNQRNSLPSHNSTGSTADSLVQSASDRSSFSRNSTSVSTGTSNFVEINATPTLTPTSTQAQSQLVSPISVGTSSTTYSLPSQQNEKLKMGLHSSPVGIELASHEAQVVPHPPPTMWSYPGSVIAYHAYDFLNRRGNGNNVMAELKGLMSQLVQDVGIFLAVHPESQVTIPSGTSSQTEAGMQSVVSSSDISLPYHSSNPLDTSGSEGMLHYSSSNTSMSGFSNSSSQSVSTSSSISNTPRSHSRQATTLLGNHMERFDLGPSMTTSTFGNGHGLSALRETNDSPTQKAPYDAFSIDNPTLFNMDNISSFEDEEEVAIREKPNQDGRHLSLPTNTAPILSSSVKESPKLTPRPQLGSSSPNSIISNKLNPLDSLNSNSFPTPLRRLPSNPRRGESEVEKEAERVNGITSYRCYRRQNGVVRINCVDCLDRTNAAMFVAAKAALILQLSTMGAISDAEDMASLQPLSSVMNESQRISSAYNVIANPIFDGNSQQPQGIANSTSFTRPNALSQRVDDVSLARIEAYRPSASSLCEQRLPVSHDPFLSPGKANRPPSLFEVDEHTPSQPAQPSIPFDLESEMKSSLDSSIQLGNRTVSPDLCDPFDPLMPSPDTSSISASSGPSQYGHTTYSRDLEIDHLSAVDSTYSMTPPFGSPPHSPPAAPPTHRFNQPLFSAHKLKPVNDEDTVYGSTYHVDPVAVSKSPVSPIEESPLSQTILSLNTEQYQSQSSSQSYNTAQIQTPTPQSRSGIPFGARGPSATLTPPLALMSFRLPKPLLLMLQYSFLTNGDRVASQYASSKAMHRETIFIDEDKVKKIPLGAYGSGSTSLSPIPDEAEQFEDDEIEDDNPEEQSSAQVKSKEPSSKRLWTKAVGSILGQKNTTNPSTTSSSSSRGPAANTTTPTPENCALVTKEDGQLVFVPLVIPLYAYTPPPTLTQARVASMSSLIMTPFAISAEELGGKSNAMTPSIYTTVAGGQGNPPEEIDNSDSSSSSTGLEKTENNGMLTNLSNGISNVLIAAKRYVKNNFIDAQKQQSINLILGNYVPFFQFTRPHIWDLDPNIQFFDGDSIFDSTYRAVPTPFCSGRLLQGPATPRLVLWADCLRYLSLLRNANAVAFSSLNFHKSAASLNSHTRQPSIQTQPVMNVSAPIMGPSSSSFSESLFLASPTQHHTTIKPNTNIDSNSVSPALVSSRPPQIPSRRNAPTTPSSTLPEEPLGGLNHPFYLSPEPAPSVTSFFTKLGSNSLSSQTVVTTTYSGGNVHPPALPPKSQVPISVIAEIDQESLTETDSQAGRTSYIGLGQPNNSSNDRTSQVMLNSPSMQRQSSTNSFEMFFVPATLGKTSPPLTPLTPTVHTSFFMSETNDFTAITSASPMKTLPPPVPIDLFLSSAIPPAPTPVIADFNFNGITIPPPPAPAPAPVLNPFDFFRPAPKAE